MLDSTLGVHPPLQWTHRYKLALHGSEGRLDDIPSVTITLGPFGDVVSFPDGRVYLSWYPVTKVAASTSIVPPDPENELDDRARADIAQRVLTELSRVLPALRDGRLEPGQFEVRGGHIFAWGETDISDPSSRLHQRHQVGVMSVGRYHSVDTGKYGLAPLHAMVVAARILGEA
jgi:hypothetical protein